MAKQTIGIGATDDDGTGDPLRTAFGKVNDNFDEVYSGAHPGYIAGNWYVLGYTGVIGSAAGFGVNTIYFDILHVPSEITVSDLGAFLTTAFSGGNIKLAIYLCHPSTGEPTGTPLAETGNISTTSTGPVSADITGSNVTLQPGRYWAAFWSDNGSAACRMIDRSSVHVSARILGDASLTNVVSTSGFSGNKRTLSSTFGSWPDVTGESFSSGVGQNFGTILALKAA